MTSILKILSFIAKIAGLAVALDWTSLSPTLGPIIFFAASLTKDTVNRLGDFLDDGKVNQSFKVIIALCVAGALIGCARFTTTQTDASYENGKIVRQVTTRAQAVTIFEAKSALANFKASQTDKTQAASVGSLAQESSGTTNAAAAAGMFLGEIIKAAK